MLAASLVDALKRELKLRGIGYAELATLIGLSEASVKRLFSQRTFTLQRLEQVLSAVGIEFQDLAQAMQDAPVLLSRLTYAQEEEILGDIGLTVVAVAALNLLTVAQIVATYRLSEAQVVAYLLRLDRIGILELRPNNRVKLLIARTFRWIPNGPIQAFFREQAYADFLDARFDGDGELLQLVNLMLTTRSAAALRERLRQVAAEFSQQHQDDARLPFAERHAVTLMLAARPWMPESFKGMLRTE
jgi:transcriptional regulator with XRE-family HTH domain